MTEELFGPIAPTATFASLDEVIERRIVYPLVLPHMHSPEAQKRRGL